MAITNAAFKSYEWDGKNTYRVRLLLTDPTKTPTTYEAWITVSGTTLVQLRDDASRQIATLNSQSAVKDILAGIAVDTAIPVTYTPPAATADDTWVGQVARYRALKAMVDAGLSNATLTADIAALKTTIESGYTTARGLLI